VDEEVLFDDSLGQDWDGMVPAVVSAVQCGTRADTDGQGAGMDDALDTSDLELDAVRTVAELAAKLRNVQIRDGKPSLRELETRTRRDATPLSKTVVAEMLKGQRLPKREVMLSFLRACHVRDDSMESWRSVWGRLADRVEQRVRSWHFADSEPVTLICAQLPDDITCPLGKPADPNYTELLSYADLDALFELYGHIRAENPDLDVSFKSSSRLGIDDLSSHVVLIGGIAWNEMTGRISEMSPLPIRQIEDPAIKTGEIFVAPIDGKEQRFLPKWSEDHSELVEDVGLIVRTPNPLNSDRSLTICNGIHSRGVVGAVRSLTDVRLRESNERYIRENFDDPSTFAILMRVPVIAKRARTPVLRAAGCVLYRWPDAGRT
jgi:hypothetical protein